MRESPSLAIVPRLIAAGGRVQAYDPEGTSEAEKLLDGVAFCDDAYAAIDGADVMVIVTEWNEFRALDLERVKGLMKRPLVVDLRNIYSAADMDAAGFEYHGVGLGKVNL